MFFKCSSYHWCRIWRITWNMFKRYWNPVTSSKLKLMFPEPVMSQPQQGKLWRTNGNIYLSFCVIFVTFDCMQNTKIKRILPVVLYTVWKVILFSWNSEFVFSVSFTVSGCRLLALEVLVIWNLATIWKHDGEVIRNCDEVSKPRLLLDYFIVIHVLLGPGRSFWSILLLNLQFCIT